MYLNIQKTLEILDEDLDLLNDIINDVLSREYEEDLFYNMDVYIKNRDFIGLDKHIHRYKGSLAVFNAEPVNDVLVQMRYNCTHKNLPAIQELYESLKIRYCDFKESLILYKSESNKEGVIYENRC